MSPYLFVDFFWWLNQLSISSRALLKTYFPISKDMKTSKSDLEKMFLKSHTYYKGMTKDEIVRAFNNILRESHLYGTQYFPASVTNSSTCSFGKRLIAEKTSFFCSNPLKPRFLARF